jgi:hypothetical protein
MLSEGLVMSIDRMGAAPGDPESRSEHRPAPANLHDCTEDRIERERRELQTLRDRHREMMDLLGCHRPEKLVHDLRNVLNELQLLRMLADSGKC